jgi:large conductance mechanosensitive channel
VPGAGHALAWRCACSPSTRSSCSAALLDLAVAFILGAAFNAVVQPLARDVIMGPISRLLRFDNIAAFEVDGILLGSFLAALLSFVVVATVLFFVIRAAARFQPHRPRTAPPRRPTRSSRCARSATRCSPRPATAATELSPPSHPALTQPP